MSYGEEISRMDEGATKSKHQELVEKFKEYSDAQASQIQRESEDLRFQVAELQWDSSAKAQRQGMGMDGVPTPARPCLSIDRLAQPRRLIQNQQRQSKPGVNIAPLSPDADEELAEIKQGIYRAIERNSKAQQARTWAFNRAVDAGRGYYRVVTEYDETTGDPFDQRIAIERILYQDGVKWDPAATKADFSDARCCFIGSWMPRSTFRAKFPKAKDPTSDGIDVGETKLIPNWVKADGKGIMVVEAFERVVEERRVALLADGSILRGEEIPKNAEILKERMEEVERVKRTIFTGLEVLKEQEWPGRYIPVITVAGNELIPFDEERRWEGIIRPNRDAQRAYNYGMSQVVEMAALEPKAPFVGAEGSFEGHETKWDNANVRNYPYLEYKPVRGPNGEALPPPQRMQVDASRMGPSMMVVQQADQALQSGTMQFDPSLGRTQGSERSGKAIVALQDQGEQANSNYLYSLVDVAMPYEATVILDLMGHIYDRVGRVTWTVGPEGQMDQVMLGQPYYKDEEGKLVPVQVATDQNDEVVLPLQPLEPVPEGVKLLYYDLSRGSYDVSVTVGKSYQTIRDQSTAILGQILQSSPELMPIVGPFFFENLDMPYAKELAEDMRILRNQQFPALAEKDGQTDPKAENASLKAQAQQMQQQLQEASQIIQTDQVKQQAQLQKAEMDNQTKLQIAGDRNQTDILLKAMEERFKRIEQALNLEHESSENDQKAAHELAMEGEKQKNAAEQILLKPAPSKTQPLTKDRSI